MDSLNADFIACCKYGLKHAVEFMINNGVDPNCNDYEGIYTALSYGNIDIVETLLPYYNDINYKDGKIVNSLTLHIGNIFRNIGFNDDNKEFNNKAIKLINKFIDAGIRFNFSHKNLNDLFWIRDKDTIRRLLDETNISDIIGLDLAFINCGYVDKVCIFENYLDNFSSETWIKVLSNPYENETKRLDECLGRVDESEYQRLLDLMTKNYWTSSHGIPKIYYMICDKVNITFDHVLYLSKNYNHKFCELLLDRASLTDEELKIIKANIDKK